jgi:hypothetical protein
MQSIVLKKWTRRPPVLGKKIYYKSDYTVACDQTEEAMTQVLQKPVVERKSRETSTPNYTCPLVHEQGSAHAQRFPVVKCGSRVKKKRDMCEVPDRGRPA